MEIIYESFNFQAIPSHIQVQNYKTLTKSTPQKNWFFWSNPYKTEFMITSLKEMPELPNFGFMTTSDISSIINEVTMVSSQA